MAWVSCCSLPAWFCAHLWFAAVVSSVVARRWVRPWALWRLWHGSLVGRFVPGACLWLDLAQLEVFLGSGSLWVMGPFLCFSWCVSFIRVFFHEGALR